MNNFDTIKSTIEEIDDRLEQLKSSAESLVDKIEHMQDKLHNLEIKSCSSSLSKRLSSNTDSSVEIQTAPYKDYIIHLVDGFSWIQFESNGNCAVIEDGPREGGPVISRHINRIHQRENDREFVNSLKSYLSEYCDSDTAHEVIDYIKTLDWVVDRNKKDTTIVEEAPHFRVILVNEETYKFDHYENALDFLNTHEYTRQTRKGATISALGCGRIYKFMNYRDLLTDTLLSEEKLVYDKNISGRVTSTIVE